MMVTRQYLALVFTLVLSLPAHAQIAGERARSWEAGFHLVDMSSASVAHSFGAAIDVEGTVGYGFTGGYNFTNRFALMLDYNSAAPDYVATFVPDGPGPVQRIRTELGVSTLQLKGVYYFFDGSVTPFAELGFGWTRLDSNIIDGPPVVDCWWDFFWGRVCRSFYETYTQTDTSYSLGLGLRWDMTTEVMMRGTVGALEIDVPSGKNPRIDTVQFDFAWRF